MSSAPSPSRECSLLFTSLRRPTPCFIRARFAYVSAWPTGIAVSATYAYSKSIDDASSIGGGGTIVAQNPFDIAADRGLSSFDQRQ